MPHQRPGQPGDAGRDAKGHGLGPRHIDPHGLRRDFGVADRRERATERRTLQIAVEEHDQQRDAEDQVVKPLGIGIAVEAEPEDVDVGREQADHAIGQRRRDDDEVVD